MGSAALGVDGVITGACVEAVFVLFFGEDLDSLDELHQYLTLRTNPHVALQADELMTLGGMVALVTFYLLTFQTFS
jgi:hypothetical protein